MQKNSECCRSSTAKAARWQKRFNCKSSPIVTAVRQPSRSRALRFFKRTGRRKIFMPGIGAQRAPPGEAAREIVRQRARRAFWGRREGADGKAGAKSSEEKHPAEKWHTAGRTAQQKPPTKAPCQPERRPIKKARPFGRAAGRRKSKTAKAPNGRHPAAPGHSAARHKSAGGFVRMRYKTPR